MSLESFASLEEAVQSSFDARFCRVIATRSQGDDAVALFDTGPQGNPYLYEVRYSRRKGRWSEGSSGNGSGWSVTDREAELGVMTVWDEAPPGADRVRLQFAGELREEPVSGGAFLAVWWGVPFREGYWPRVVAFRVDGAWTAAPMLVWFWRWF
jgi:hypothetical protein